MGQALAERHPASRFGAFAESSTLDSRSHTPVGPRAPSRWLALLYSCQHIVRGIGQGCGVYRLEDLKKIDVPTLILHGDDDQIVPIADSALLSAKIVKNGTLKIYKGAPHGMCTTHKHEINKDLLEFIKA